MCEPISATAMMWISIGTAAVSAYATDQTAKAQAGAIETQQENERREAKDIAEEELGVRVKEAREKRARARVAAGESGALGASFAAAMNLSFTQRGISDRANTALAGINDPSALEAGLSIASAGLSGYNAGIGLEQRREAAAEGTKGSTGSGRN